MFGLILILLFFLFFAFLLFYAVPRLLLRARHHRRMISKMAKRHGWTIDRTPLEFMPAEVEQETLHNIGIPGNYASFSCWIRITGEHRGRPFLVVGHGKRRHRSRDSGSGTVHIFTQLSEIERFSPLFLHLNSTMMDGLLSVDAMANAAEDVVNAPHFPKVGLPQPYSESFSLRGTKGAADMLTPDIREALLARPDFFYRKDEKWHMRFGSMIGLTERYAFIDIMDLHPGILMRRLDLLMDWAELVDAAHPPSP